MSNENSKLLSTLASNVDSSTTSQSFSSCLTNTGEKNDLKEFKDAETELKEDSETELKDLLEEAYSYKTPGDKKNKSKKFLQLLHEVESETEDNGKFPQSLTRYGTASSQYHHSQSHGGHQKYGGSLQNLVDIDCSNHSLKGRRHFISLGGNQFSRTKKSSSSSVSTRQREGGSLPSNVNNTNLDLRKDQLKHNLLHEVTKTTNTITTTTTTKECLHNSDTNTHTTGSIGLLTSSSSFVNSMADTVIDMEVDNIDEDICSYISNYAKSKPQKKSNDTGKTEFVEMIEQKHLVDEKITFSSLDRSTNLETLNRGLPLDDNYKSCTSVLEKGNSNARRTTAIVTTASSLSNALTEGFTAASTGINVSSIGTVSLKQYDENGNLNMAGNSPNGISGNTSNTSNNSQSQAKAKSTKRQKEKNVRVFKAGDIPCNCGDQDINILVSFINNDSSSNENKNKKIKKKDKEKDGKSNPVIQKSSSLEELRSCTKLTADDNDNVTLRNKGIKNPKSGSKAGNSNNNVIRKGERRSWGTEEIPYYNELTTEDTKPKKKTSDTKINKKDVYGTEIPTKVHSMESINSEPSDFLLVTKKKKPKKRQTMDDSNFTSSNHNYSTRSGVFATNNSSNNNTNTTKKSGQNNEFQSYRKENSNNSYDNSQSVNSQTGIPNQKSRRKSTSSMPPSDKSDLSDSDSVHSLPIESNKKSSQNTSIKQKNHHHQKNQPQSYAEITKRKKSQGNATIATTASTPTTTSTTTITTNDVGVNTSSTTILKEDSSSISSNIKTKPKTKHKPVIDFPELVPTSAPISTSNTTTPQISYSQSLVSPAAAAAAATVATTNNNNEALSATSPTSTTLSTNDCEFMQPKQMLHKSKSMDNESNSSSNSKHNNSQSSNNLLYNSIDQYPALEKTVKRSSNNNNNNNSTSGDSSTTTIINEQPKVSTSCAIDVKKKSTNTLFSSTSKKSKKLCPNTSMGNRNSNRPAVIIINDDPNRCETAKLSQFTFGDFKEDELKFLGTSEEPPFNMNSTLKSNQDINVSLESDNGYSSSLNQSAKTMNEEDTITTTDSQNSSSIRHININNTNNSSSKATNTVSLGNKMNKKIKTCSEIEDSLTSQVQIMPGSNAGLNFKFMENPADEDDEDEEYLEDEDDETNATTSTNIGDDDNDNANVNENNIEVDIRVINNNKSSCILSFKPPPTNILLPSHNDHIIDFIGSAWEEVIKSKVTLFLQK